MSPMGKTKINGLSKTREKGERKAQTSGARSKAKREAWNFELEPDPECDACVWAWAASERGHRGPCR